MNDIFKAHELDGDEVTVSDTIRTKCNELYNYIKTNTPDSRERSLALTKLEECAMWSNKGVALHGTTEGSSKHD